MQAEGDVFIVVPICEEERINDGWIEGGGERNEPWNSSRETLLPGSDKTARKPGAIVSTCDDGGQMSASCGKAWLL